MTTTSLWAPLRRWWQISFGATAEAATVPALRFRAPARRAGRRATPSPVSPYRQPVTPFGNKTGGPARGARRAAGRFWMTLDPEDRRRGAIGGSFAEVCAALERLAAIEEAVGGQMAVR